MSKRWKLGIAALLVAGASLAVTFAAWRMVGPFGPARNLVGVWDIESGQPIEDAVRGELAQKAQGAAEALGPKFRSTERVYLERNGNCRHVQDLLGLTITSEGTWQARRREGDQLVVTLHTRRLSVRNPKGETQEKEEDSVIEWVVSPLEGGQLLVSIADGEGRTQRFRLRRAEE